MRLKHLLMVVLAFAFITACQTPSTQTEPNKLLLVSFDGFRVDYLSKTDTPNFDKLVSSGVVSEGMIPIFPSKTFPNHYAIATGLYPENSGFVGNNMYDAEMGKSFSIGNREAVENADWYGGEPIWNTLEKAGVKTGTMFWVGSEAPIQDMRPTHWKKYDGGMPDSARIDTVLKWLDLGNEKEVDFATLYFSFVDTYGHRYGPNSEETVAAIQRADELIGYLTEQLKERGLADQTNLMVVSDHGMAEVSRERLVLLDEFINPDELQMVEYSPALMANVRNGNLEEVYQVLKESAEHFRVYKKDEIPERFHLKNHHRVPDLLLIADVGYTISTRQYVEERPGYPAGGAHGFDNQAPEMHSLFVAAGPDFKKGYQMETFENIHLYPLMVHLLDVEPAPVDGSLDSVSVMLN
ncbi:ectonucleotide pyrophosphatase/phosphodiesterase [Gracilimonas mengyeensis]|uniref:Predicted pyrophosphatase or phosphodiesterase, AlkP superfamily n=1 Tax=Gracilimonas mengyeensis TaxID=1302730 RepID=A0A521FAU1_9BACT|nr:ectonucleotide pyrophosphatase/phosphodiesterase [Gracilimonas mengyeensis]SMO93322.1 Predicted pyrophosphatase or phosphodiesterase, AlkP superfamily [Gracilimonas mengyeensis]